MNWWKQHWQMATVCLILAAMTFAVFGQTADFGFVNLDDNVYVYENARVAGGLSLKGLGWIFSHADCELYHPLTMLSLMVDYQLHGLHAGGYHLTNVLLHTASVILLFLILRQMTGALWRSAFVAAVFAIHPLRVESVAWVAERKDVLSAFFFMLTLGAYVRYARKPNSVARYLMVAVAFAMALLCKPTVVTLPFVLLLLDYWPLQRFESRKLSGLILEKIPLLALAAGAGAITVLVTRGSILPTVQLSAPVRIGNALVYYMVYLRQAIWPEGLAMAYPYPANGVPLWEMALAGALLASLSAVAWRACRTQPWLLVGWLWYLGMLTPMIGLKPVGVFPLADRYTYLPQIGIYVAVTWLVAEWRVNRVALGGLMSGVLGVLLVCAWKQTAYWKDSETAWTRTLDCTTNNSIACNDFAEALSQIGRVDEAIAWFQKAVQIKPDYWQAHYNLGIMLRGRGRMDEALVQFRKAAQCDPGKEDAHYQLGNTFRDKGEMDNAIAEYQKALEITPDDADAHYNLGLAFSHEGRVDEAMGQYQSALRLKPGNAEARNNLGILLDGKGKSDEAIVQFRQAVQIKPDYEDAHNNLGICLMEMGKVDEAISHYQRALELKPDDPGAHNNLGNALLQQGKEEEAMAQFQQALQLKPDDPSIQNNLASLLATSSKASLRNGVKAVELASQANVLTGGKNPVVLETMAAAFAEEGRFSEAAETVQQALRLAGEQSALVKRLQFELNLYQADSPFHRPEQSH
ncbi:MAG: tetratricopeptide repeat protein [Limisphaerales bacterium]